MNCIRVKRSGGVQASIRIGITRLPASSATDTSSATLGEAAECGDSTTINPSQPRTAASTARSQCSLGWMSYWSTQTFTPAAIRSPAMRSARASARA